MAGLDRIEPCAAPAVVRESTTGPSTPLDHDILRFMAQRGAPVSLAAIRAAVGATTHKTHARVRALQDRGMVRRTPLPDGPRRGPGASVYSLTAEAPR